MNNELEELEDEIDRIILKNNIRLIYSKLESSDPDMAVISKNNRRAIIINTNYDIKTSVIMRKSHELMHHLFNDYDTSITYTYSEQLKNQHEINANVNAINLIAQIVYREVPMEYRDWLHFMNNLQLPLHFKDIVINAIKGV